jgi:pilus assembly protein Flp/PilA
MWYQMLYIRLHQLINGVIHYLFDADDNNKEADIGQGLVEYAMLLMLVGVIVMGMLTILGAAVGNMFQNIIDHINNI